ncbi:MAG: phage/plasmid primase, P4 family [Rhodospirillaceae bacterium]
MPNQNTTDSTENLDLHLSTIPHNDVGNAERFVARYGDITKYCKDIGWIAWTGKDWSDKAGKSFVTIKCEETAKAIKGEAKAMTAAGPRRDSGTKQPLETEEELRKRVRKHRDWAVASGQSNRIRAMRELAQAHLEVHPEQLDADPYLLNLQNGMIDLRQGPDFELLPHQPKRLVTKIAEVRYEPNASQEVFTTFLKSIQPDAEVRAFLQRWFGLALTGEMNEQRLVMFSGSGANGKSTLANAVRKTLGSYATVMGFSSLLKNDRRGGADASPDIARLKGKRAVFTSEVDQSAVLSESLIKSLTGGEPILARHLHQAFFEFEPEFKLTTSVNNKPIIRGQDDGIWRRMIIVNFPVKIDEKDRDPNLEKTLEANSSGILNWMLDGYRLWQEEGLCIPASILEQTQVYRDESDPIGEFLNLWTRPKTGARIGSTALYKKYVLWCGENEIRPVGRSAFGVTMTAKGYEKQKSNTYYYVDLEFAE